MVTRKGVKAAIKHDLGAAERDVKKAGEKAEGALKTAGGDVKKTGVKLKKKL